MNYTKRNSYLRLLLFAFLLLPSLLFSQVRVSGKLLDSYNNPIEFGKVTIIEEDSLFQNITYSDSLGFFVIDISANRYQVIIDQNGILIFKETIDIYNDLDLGDIIYEDTTELDEVVILQKKKLIERKIDRLIFNVENSISLAGSDASDALRSTPGIRVINNNIKIIGKAGMMVMVDDRIVELSGDDLMNFLKTISSENIKSIEVITAPPAKYSASGNSGLINIKLKKAKEDAWSSTVGMSLVQRVYFSESLQGNFNYNKDKLTVQSSLNIGNAISENSDHITTYYSDETWDEKVPRKITNKNLGYRLAAEYEVSKKWSTGFIITGSNSKINSKDNSLINIFNKTPVTLKSYVDTDLTSFTKPAIFSANYHNTILIDTIGTQITTDVDYFDYSNIDERLVFGNEYNANNVTIPTSNFAITTDNRQSISNLSGKVDVEMPLSWTTFSYGAKISVIKSENILKSYNLENNEPELDQQQSNKFNYRENNQALYFSANKKFGDKWELQAALRVEATQTEGYSKNYDQKNKNDYIKIFPTLYFQYVANINSTYSINYSRRILRPSYEMLNPFKNYDSPYSYVEGNPFVQPSFSDNLEFNYSYKNFDSKFSYNKIENGFEHFGIVDPISKITRYTVLNFLDTQTYSISFSHTYNKIGWWTSINSLDSGYSNAKSSADFTNSNVKGNYTFASTNNDFILNSSKSMVLNASYWYQFKSTMGIYEFKPYGSFSLTARYMVKNNLQLSLNLNDIFKTQLSKSSNYSNEIRNDFSSYYDARHIRLSIQYKFGNTKLKSINKESGNTEEQNRLK